MFTTWSNEDGHRSGMPEEGPQSAGGDVPSRSRLRSGYVKARHSTHRTSSEQGRIADFLTPQPCLAVGNFLRELGGSIGVSVLLSRLGHVLAAMNQSLDTSHPSRLEKYPGYGK